jgi:hypothetical protein
MHSDVAYDVDECDCSLRDCSLNASIVLGEDRSEGFFVGSVYVKISGLPCSENHFAMLDV